MAQIKKDTSLRKAILQAAITGQLISSCHSELDSESAETGKELLGRIIEERNNKLLAEWKEALKKNPKARKPVPVVASVIDEEEIPFEIPENWCWCRIDDLFSHNTGKALNKSENKEGTELEYITTSNLYWNYFELDNLKTMPFKDSEIEKCTVQKGDLLVCEGGEVGRTAIWNFDRTICIQNHIHRLRAYETSLNKSFYYYVMFLYKEGKLIDDYAKGIGIKGLSSNALGSIIIPLPPLAVQNAIVAKLEQVLPLVDAYENALLQKEELKSALPDKVKKAILQEAITGKLTEAWRKSATIKESGKQLLDRIIEERNAKALAEWEESLKKNPKAKKPVPVIAREIEEEEIPFEVPESWCWCRLGDLASIARGGSPRPINDFLTNEPDGYNWIKISDTDKGGKYINGTKQKIKKEGLYKTRLIHKGDFLLTNSMSFGRPYISNIDGCIHDGWLVFSFINELINPDFIYNLLSSPFIYDSFSQSAAGGVVQNLNTDKVIDTLVPLPSLKEQQEIVKKLEELLPLCK